MNQQVKRNIYRFPADFMFELTTEEAANLRSQIVTSSLMSQAATPRSGWGGRRHLPRVFTEHGTIMLASVLNSERAIEASIFFVRAFVRMREMLSVNKEFTAKLADLKRRVAGHDDDLHNLVVAIRRLMAPSEPPRRKIGFHTDTK